MEQDGPSKTAADAYDYYLSIANREVQGRFRCLDNPSNLDQLDGINDTNTNNFVVDFSDDTAWAAFDLSTEAIQALLDEGRPEALNTRWINVFRPFHHRSLLEVVAKKYDFSPRLLALMCSDPNQLRTSASRTTIAKPIKKSFWRRKSASSVDTEAEVEHDEISEHSSVSSRDSAAQGNLYKIADDIWHYSSVDLGRQYVCIGYNSLYGTKHSQDNSDDGTQSLLPHCTRVWTWLVLSEDNTVITINEDPFPLAYGGYSPVQLRVLAETRRNLVNVFRSLSNIEEQPLHSRNPMTLLPIRTRVGHTPEETAHRDTDTPGLLFYYLFENWHNSYTLVTRRESRYGIELAQLRTEMLQQPTLGHIDRLDLISKELGILQKHYEAYNRIISRLLEPCTASPTAASLQNSQVVTSTPSDNTASDTASLNTVRPVVPAQTSLMGVSLSSAARVRFTRLRDLIDLYALREVEEYLSQTRALTTMTFNLIAIKQSVDVEKLTRITLLLTKATILFLPVSLMTSYFGMQLVGVEYRVGEYWVAFAVIFVLSWGALVLLGVWNGNVQSWEVVRGMGGSVVLVWRWVGRLLLGGHGKGT